MSSYPLYFDDDLKLKINKIAQIKHRSLNAQIIHILEGWLRDQPTEDEETQSAITESNPGSHIQTPEERAAALKTQGDWPEKCL